MRVERPGTPSGRGSSLAMAQPPTQERGVAVTALRNAGQGRACRYSSARRGRAAQRSAVQRKKGKGSVEPLALV